MYVQKNDYLTRITEQRLNILIQQNEEILSDANNFACEIIRGYLGSLYSIDDEFKKSGNQRNGLILHWAINIGLYILYQRAADSTVPEKVIKNYDDTIAYLEKVASGKTQISLPRKNTETGNIKTILKIGSDIPRSHKL